MDKFVGLTKVLNNGLEATIIAFRDFYDIDVQLCTGEISTNQQFSDFQSCDAAALGFKKKQIRNEPFLDEPFLENENQDELAFLYLYK